MGTGATEKVKLDWITKELLVKAIKNLANFTSPSITDFKIVNLTTSKEDDHSKLYRIAVELEEIGSNKNISLILKVPSNKSNIIKKTSELTINREVSFYSFVYPKIIELLEQINDTTKISPKCVYAIDDKQSYIILEDVTKSDMSAYPEGRLLNLEHSLIIIDKLAKLHACSAVLCAQDSNIKESFTKPEQTNNLFEIAPGAFKTLAEEVIQWKGYEKIAEKLDIINTKFNSPTNIDLFGDDDKDFLVINHNNVWINNMFFHYNEHEPDDGLLVDYQLSYYGSPGIDLAYFLYGSVNENCRKIHFKFLIREYHRIVKDTMERLNYNGYIPTVKDIHIQIIKKSLHGVIAAVCLTSRILTKPSEGEEAETEPPTNELTEFEYEFTHGIRYKKYIQKLLKEFELNGFLD